MGYGSTGGSDTSSSSSSSSGVDWGKIINGLVTGYMAQQSATQHNAAAAKASAPQTVSTFNLKTPYMNPQLQALMPYIMSQAQAVYAKRAGLPGGVGAGDFSPFASALSAMQPDQWLTDAQKMAAAGPGAGFSSAQGSTGQGSSAPSIGSGSGNGTSSGSEGILQGMNSSGSVFDSMLTPEQRAASATEVTPEMMKNAGMWALKNIPAIAGGIPGLVGAGLNGGINSGINHLVDWGKGLFGGPPTSVDQLKVKPPGSLSELPIDYKGSTPADQNAAGGFYFDENGNLRPKNPIKNDKFSADSGMGIGSGGIFAGTSSPWDWGDKNGASYDRTGGGGGGNKDFAGISSDDVWGAMRY